MIWEDNGKYGMFRAYLIGITAKQHYRQKCGAPQYLPTKFAKIKKDFTLEWLEKIGKKDIKDCYPKTKPPSQIKFCKPYLVIPRPRPKFLNITKAYF